jgi:hypothetical protein
MFRYNHQPSSDFVVTLDIEFGMSASVYVITAPEEFDEEITTYFARKPEDAYWKNEEQHALNEVFIDSLNEKYCSQCEYFISVFSDKKARFRIKVHIDDVSSGARGALLTMQHPLKIKVKEGRTELLHFWLPLADEDLEIKLSTSKRITEE